MVGGDRSSHWNGLGTIERPVSVRGDVMSQQSVRQAARRSALDAQAARRKERADRERRLEGLAVAVLTALGERDGAVKDAEKRAGEALRAMSDDDVCQRLSVLARRAEPATQSAAGTTGADFEGFTLHAS